MLVRLNLYWIWEKVESWVTFWHQSLPLLLWHLPTALQISSGASGQLELLPAWQGFAPQGPQGHSPHTGAAVTVPRAQHSALEVSCSQSQFRSDRARTSLGLQVEQVTPHVPHCLHVIPDLGVGVEAQDLGGVGKWQSFYGLWNTTTQTLVTQNTSSNFAAALLK